MPEFRKLRAPELTPEQIKAISALISRHGRITRNGPFKYNTGWGDQKIAELIGVTLWQVRVVRKATKGRIGKGRAGSYGPTVNTTGEAKRLGVVLDDHVELRLPLAPKPATDLWTEITAAVDKQIETLDTLMKEIQRDLHWLEESEPHAP